MLRYTNFEFCPKCGSKTLYENDKKSVKCKNCDFIYFHNVAAAVGALIIKNGKILLVRRAFEPEKGKLDIPGGFCDYGESLEDSLKREIFEELNVKTSDLKYFSSFPNKYKFQNIEYHTTDVFFLAKLTETKIRLNDEIIEFVWKEIKNFDLGQIGFSSIRNVLKKLKSKVGEM